jgi:hypothetical protein
MGAIRLSLVRMSQRNSMGTDQMCCRHFHGYITLLFTGTSAPSHPPKNPFCVTGSIMSACCQSSIIRSNLWNSAVSTRLHRMVRPALAQFRNKQTDKQPRHLIDLHPIHNQAISRKFTLLRDGFLNSVFALDYSLR